MMDAVISISRTQNFEEARSLLEDVDAIRTSAFAQLDTAHRAELGQFPTPMQIAAQMASLFQAKSKSIRLLDAGAGAGSLTAAFVSNLCQRSVRPTDIQATAFEMDGALAPFLERSLKSCERACTSLGVNFSGRLRPVDFIHEAVSSLDGGLFGGTAQRFNCAILNPPYKKIRADSDYRQLLRRVGIETSNLYTAFLALAIMLLEPDGELVAITPRSFCNGPYFQPFRKFFLDQVSVRYIHIFDSRSESFQADDVLQENIIFHAVKTRERAATTQISSSKAPGKEAKTRVLATDQLVKPEDPEQFIHIICDQAGSQACDQLAELPCSLPDLGLSVSTGRLVEFRSRSCIRIDSQPGAVPLIYPAHLAAGKVLWPRPDSRKPNACIVNENSLRCLIPAAIYVLVKRFSAKEEQRRLVAAIFDPDEIPCDRVAFENHLNYFHAGGKGLSRALAVGLSAFLNSAMADTYFRQFSGHTQVNATDLRSFRYPSKNDLEKLGSQLDGLSLNQRELDEIIRTEQPTWRRDRGAAQPKPLKIGSQKL